MALKRNKIFFFVFKLAVSSSLLIYIFSKTGVKNVLGTLSTINPFAFLCAVFLYVFAQFISTLRWKLLLPPGLRTGKLFSLYMIGAFFNTILPGIIGGDAVKAFYLYQTTGRGTLVFASIFMDRYLGFVVLLAIGAIAYPFGFRYLQGSGFELLLPFIIGLAIVVSMLVFGLRLGKKFRRISDFYEYFHMYRNQKKIIMKALGFSLVVQFTGMLAVYIIGIGLGVHIPFVTYLIFMPLIILFSTIPISISGLGIREGSFVLFFSFIGVKPEVATAISFLWFLTMMIGGLYGLIEYMRYKQEKPAILS